MDVKKGRRERCVVKMNCKNCGKEVKEDWNICPYCMQPIQEMDGNVNDEVAEEKRCLQCGSKLKEGAKFCAQCGMQVGEKVVQTNADKKEWKLVKSKRFGKRLRYGTVVTNLQISGNEVYVGIQGKKKNIEVQQNISNLRSVEIKSTFDFWATLYSVMFFGLGLFLIIYGYGEAFVGWMLAGIWLWRAYGKVVVLNWADGSKTEIPTQGDGDAENMITYLEKRIK